MTNNGVILVEILYINCMIGPWFNTGNGTSGNSMIEDHQKSQVIEHEEKVGWQGHIQTYQRCLNVQAESVS